MLLALGDQTQKTPPGMLVFVVFLQMFGKFFYPLSQNGNLNFRRAGIGLVDLDCFYGSLFFGFCQHFSILSQINKKTKGACLPLVAT